MGRSNKRRKTSMSISCGYYYPVYTGWVTKITPCFTTPSAAICYQLVQYQRNLSLHNTLKKPTWLDCVGSIHPSHFKNIESSIFHTHSKIESAYFENVKFFRIKNNSYIESRLVRVASQTFLSCKNTLKENTDYQSSSNSIYRPGSFCVEELNAKSFTFNFDKNGISQKRDSNNLIAMYTNAKHLINKSNFQSVDCITERLANAAKSYQGKEIVVSFGAGSGTTELASSTLTLCLDINKSSIFTGLSQIAGDISTQSTVYALMDYCEHSSELLNAIHNIIPGKVIRVLLQHPNPSINKGNTSKLSLLFESLRMSLKKGILHDVTFVYDFSPNRNTWSKAMLESFFIANSDKTHFTVTDEMLLSYKGDNTVNHPLFGLTKRYGWAAMRNCAEYSFAITYHNIKN